MPKIPGNTLHKHCGILASESSFEEIIFISWSIKWLAEPHTWHWYVYVTSIHVCDNILWQLTVQTD